MPNISASKNALTVSSSTNSVNGVKEIVFPGATVAEAGGNVATVIVPAASLESLAALGVPVLRDLGVFNAVDLLEGRQLLFTPAAGDFVQIVLGRDDYVNQDGDFDIYVGQDLARDPSSTSPQNCMARVLLNTEGPAAVLDQTSGRGQYIDGVGEDGETENRFVNSPMVPNNHPVYVALVTDRSVQSSPVLIGDASQAWQAEHAYAEGDCVLAPNGVVYECTTAGTSDTTIPDEFGEGLTEDPITDGGVTWGLYGLAPTTGTLHVYALTNSAIS